ncbi:hypothetical protein ACO0LO_05015 [Undibacterium sp. TJN25]|uniref:hypothetical protein n=1 Tax=Undibacterium sp. TJN25 TaxID=3413056 RepID=UPI003BF19DDF
MMPSKTLKADSKPVQDISAGRPVEAGEASIPSTLDDDVSIEQFTKGNLGEDIDGLPDESVDMEREASFNKDEPDLDLDGLDPVPPK